MALLAEGQKIGGTYEVERFLGEGAFAEVYRVKHRFLGRQAMKVFKAPGMTLEETVNALGEAVLLSRLGHPNIIRVFDANLLEIPSGKFGYFTMEYVAGGSLQQFWRSFGSRFIPPETVVDVTRQICRGLSVAHSERPPIVHRDIKPQNILVGYEPDGLRVRLSDFGLAKKANPLTLLVSARGTLLFKAPEAFSDYQGDSCTGDVWAVGVTMYLLMTDRYPFEVPEEIGAMNAKCFEAPVPYPSRLNVLIDPELDRIVVRAISVNPKQRYQSAVELLGDLEAWRPAANPLPLPSHRNSAASKTSKTVLGQPSPINERTARAMVKEAFQLAQGVGHLNEAADMLEETLNKWPSLRIEYEGQVRLWRKGVLM
jgi:serine/threonine-protein kinase